MFRNHGFVNKGNKWAVLSSDFKEVSDYVFENVSHFNKQGVSLVKQKSQWQLIDTNGIILSQLPFDKVIQFNTEDIYKKAGNNGKYGYIDRNYKTVIPFEYEDVGDAISSPNDVFPVKKEGKWGYVDKLNNLVVPFKYAFVTSIYKGFGLLKDNNFNTIGVVNSNGKIIFDDKRYSDIEYAQEGKLIYSIKNASTGKNMKGYLDSASFQVKIEAQFDNCEHFNKGFAIVKMNGLSALINKFGKIVIPYQYNYLSRWKNNYFATQNGKTGLIDISGNIIVPLEYENCSYGGSYATITKNNLKGILHISGKVLIMPNYEHIEPITEKVFYVIKSGNRFLIDLDGTEKRIE